MMPASSSASCGGIWFGGDSPPAQNSSGLSVATCDVVTFVPPWFEFAGWLIVIAGEARAMGDRTTARSCSASAAGCDGELSFSSIMEPLSGARGRAGGGRHPLAHALRPHDAMPRTRRRRGRASAQGRLG